MSKLVTLELWAESNLSPAPGIGTLRTWARDGRFSPEAVKHGRTYYVAEDAKYCAPKPLQRDYGASLINRIERARNVTQAA